MSAADVRRTPKARRRAALVAVSVACLTVRGGAAGPPTPTPMPATKDDVTMPQLELLPGAAGATRLHVAPGSACIVSDHRGWLADAFGERGDEAPGLVKLLGPDGALLRAASGWPLGGPLADDHAAWIEETGEEYRYRVVRSDGATAPLAPPDDFWVVAAAAGHPASPLAAVVLWRPARGTSPRDPASRRDELWLAAIDRRGPTVVATRELALSLPLPRAEGVLVGGPEAAPVVTLIGVPDPDAAGVYRAVGLRLPALDTAWETALDVAAAEAARPPVQPRAAEDATIPAPAPHVDAATLREFSSVGAAALGDGSGWLVGHGTRIRAIHTTTLAFLLEPTGDARPLPELRLRGASQFGPISGEPAIWALAMVGPHDDQRFAGVDLVWPRAGRIATAVDLRTQVDGQRLQAAPHRQPETVAARGGSLLGAPPALGDGFGFDAADVVGLLTTPEDWHQPGRARVRARRAWLDARSQP